MATAKKQGSKSKADSSKKSASKKAKKSAKKATVGSGMNELLASAASCGGCVFRIIGEESGLMPKPTDKLSDLFDPCNQGVINRLKTRFRAECRNTPGMQFNCSSTVADVIIEVCGTN